MPGDGSVAATTHRGRHILRRLRSRSPLGREPPWHVKQRAVNSGAMSRSKEGGGSAAVPEAQRDSTIKAALPKRDSLSWAMRIALFGVKPVSLPSSRVNSRVSDQNRNVRCLAKVGMSAVLRLSSLAYEGLPPRVICGWTPPLLSARLPAAVGRIGLRYLFSASNSIWVLELRIVEQWLFPLCITTT